ncbi:TPA: tail fiber assembly protein [Serratia marcescens]|uniref:tail fiber assembly protein n=1 Tax=Serratia sarumanii TaxID=3020826 RepID=UPI001A187665|nr:tail fiber assembly protein [Serratia marcescens]HEJ7160020.1 tail fiber assembly protein [Serratia marcescens]HEM7586000.1 tail fiber assembly protein [Serratia marcescens]
MKYGYSAKENAFYPIHLKAVYVESNNWPNDIVLVSENIYSEFTTTRTDGYKRIANGKGMPSWVSDVTSK